MADENKSGTDHSLSASIDLDFTVAAQKAAAFAEKIDDISKSFNNISTKAKAINNTTGQKLQEILNNIGSAQQIEVTDVATIREKIERAIVRSIVEGGVNIKGLDETFNISFAGDSNELKKIQEEIGKKIRGAAAKAKINSFELGAPVTLGPRVIGHIREEFGRKLRNAIGENPVDFDFKNAKGELTKFKLDVKAEHMQGMLDAVRNKLIDHLAHPDNIHIQGGWEKPIPIVNDDLRKVYEELAATVQQLTGNIKVDTKPIESLNANDFTNKLNQFNQQMQLIHTALKNVNLKADEEDLRAFLGNLKSLKSNLIGSLEKFLTSVRNQLDSINHPSVPDLKAQLNNLSNMVHAAINSMFNGSIENILGSMKTLRTANLDVNKILEPVIRRLEQVLLQVAQKVIAAAAGGSYEVNVDFSKVLREFNDMVTHRITTLLQALQASNDQGKPVDISKMLRDIDNSISRLVVGRLTHMADTIKTVNTGGGEFGVKVSSLDKEVVKMVAERMQMTVAELRKQKTLTGNEAMSNVAEGNLQSVMNKFHQVINEQATKQVDQYKVALDAVQVAPDLSSVPYLIKKFEQIQFDVTAKVKELLDMQFAALAAAIKGINATPLSIATPVVTQGKAPKVVVAPAGRVSVGAGAGISPSAPVSSRYDFGRTQSRTGNGSGHIFMPINDYDEAIAQRKYANPGGDTNSFMGSVRNTMRYILAGSLMGIPATMAYQGWDATKEFDYQMQKARVNVDAKSMINGTPSDYNNKEMRRHVLDMAIANSVDVKDASKAYQAATMKFDNPYEALTVARSATKLKSIEDLDVEQAAKGLTAMSAQWHLSGKDIEQVTNMMIMAANTKFTTVADLLEMQKRSGSVFQEALPGMSKRQQLATSIGLSSLYSQSTGKSGEQGGTFWKNALMNPLMGRSLEYFQGVSQSTDPQLAALNPYIERTNANGEKVMEQKNGLDMLFAVTDALNSNLDASKKNEIMMKYSSQWHVADMGAMQQAFMEDSKKIGDNSTIQKFGGVKAFFDQLGGDPEKMDEAVAMLSGAMKDSYKFKTQRLRTEWQATSVDVLDALKGDFSSVASQLSSLLRLLRENADSIAQVVSIAGKAATVLGVRYVAQWASNKRKEGMENQRQTNLARNFDQSRSGLNEEGRYANLNRIIVADAMADKQNELNKVNQKRGLIGQEQNHAALTSHNEQLGLLDNHISRYQDQKVTIQGKHPNNYLNHPQYIAAEKQIEMLSDERDKVQKSKMGIERNIAIGAQFDPGLEAEAKRLETQLRELKRKFDDVDKSAKSVNTRMDMLDQSARDYRLEMSRLSTVMHRVNLDQEGLSANSLGLKNRLTMLGQAAGMDSQQITRLITTVEKLAQEFYAGEHSADQFLKKLREIERQYMLNNTMIRKDAAGNTVSAFHGSKGTSMQAAATEAQFGGQLANTVLGIGGLAAATGMLGRKGGMEAAPEKANIFSRLLGFGKKAAEAAVESPAGAMKAAGTGILRGVGGAGKGLGKLALRGLKAVPGLGLALSAFDVFNNGISSIWKTPAERELARADSAKGVAQMAEWGANHGILGKITGTVGMGLSGGLDGLIRLAGGTSASFGEYGTGISNMWSGKTGDELAKLNEGDLKYTEKAAKAQAEIERKMLAEQKAKDLSTAGLDGTADNVDWSKVKTYEEGKQMVQQIQTETGQKLEAANAKNQLAVANNTIRGIEQDSETMRNLMIQFFDTNIKVLDEAIKAAEERQKKAPVGSDAFKAVGEEIDKMKSQKAEQEIRQYESQTSRVGTYMSDLDYKSTMTGHKYAIAKDRLLLSGAPEDSALVKNIDQRMYLEQNQNLAEARNALVQLLDEYKNDAKMSKEIQRDILDIDQRSNDNLVAIKKAMQAQKSTFNLPDGVNPMTYWEQQVKDGTHKSVSIGGDTNVTVMIDKMSGSEADLQRMGETVAAAIRRDRMTSVSQELASQVRTGIQNNHR